MLTVNEVGRHYGVRDAFIVRALDQIGFKNATPHTGPPTPSGASGKIAAVRGWRAWTQPVLPRMTGWSPIGVGSLQGGGDLPVSAVQFEGHPVVDFGGG